MSKSVYMIIHHVTRTLKGTSTHDKATVENPDNWETSENMILVDRVSNKYMREASVVLDLLNGKVMKNRFGSNSSTVFSEYVDRYQSDITGALKEWAVRHPDNYKKIQSLMGSTGEQNDEVNSD